MVGYFSLFSPISWSFSCPSEDFTSRVSCRSDESDSHDEATDVAMTESTRTSKRSKKTAAVTSEVLQAAQLTGDLALRRARAMNCDDAWWLFGGQLGDEKLWSVLILGQFGIFLLEIPLLFYEVWPMSEWSLLNSGWIPFCCCFWTRPLSHPFGRIFVIGHLTQKSRSPRQSPQRRAGVWVSNQSPGQLAPKFKSWPSTSQDVTRQVWAPVGQLQGPWKCPTEKQTHSSQQSFFCTTWWPSHPSGTVIQICWLTLIAPSMLHLGCLLGVFCYVEQATGSPSGPKTSFGKQKQRKIPAAAWCSKLGNPFESTKV